jgi:hypothetical protein
MDGEPENKPRSGVSRLWLIEYYTQELAKKQAERDAEAQPEPLEAEAVEATAQPKRKVRKKKRAPRAVVQLVTKAEADLDKLLEGVADASAAQLFIFQLLNFALDYPPPEGLDFLQIAAEYKKRAKTEDDDLLLLSCVI